VTQGIQADFGDFADWPTVMFGNTEQAILWVVFLEDLIAPEKAVGWTTDSARDDLSVVLHPLVHRLSNTKHPTLVAFSTWRSESVVSQSRLNSTWARLSGSFTSELIDLAEKFPSLFILDLDRVFAEFGRVDCFDSRNYYSFRCRLSSVGLELLTDSAQKILSRFDTPAKKVVVVDCDDTLWGGILGEVGVSGISLGADGLGMVYTDIQRSLKRWLGQGVLLAVASKNDEEHVWEVFDQHPEMQIRRDDLVAWRVNWDDKSSNLMAIAEELDLGLDSFVFLDNSSFEREQIRQLLPQVAIPELPEDITAWPAMLDSLDELARFSRTDEDSTKVAQYRQRSAFVSALTEAGDREEFLKSIAMQPGSLQLSDDLLVRAEQLCQKTNQFNLRTVRHTVPTLREVSADANHRSFLVSLEDRFGTHGTVGLVVAFLNEEVAFVDSFILSCRVLGRHLEAWVLQELITCLQADNCDWLVAEFRPTERNSVARSFLSDHGLVPLGWKGLPVNHPVNRMKDLVSSDAHAFYADLRALEVPNLEAFES
jgi:FkbH-like protein